MQHSGLPPILTHQNDTGQDELENDQNQRGQTLSVPKRYQRPYSDITNYQHGLFLYNDRYFSDQDGNEPDEEAWNR